MPRIFHPHLAILLFATLAVADPFCSSASAVPAGAARIRAVSDQGDTSPQDGRATIKRPFTFEDMMALKRISDPVVSPDGKWVMFSAVDVSLEENTRKSHLWTVPLAGGDAKKITDTPAGEDRGRFSPDGKSILFTSSSDGSSQIWTQSFDTANGMLSGDAKKVTNISTEADGGLWTPDGKSIVFISEVYPDCNDDACNRERDEALAKSKVKAKIFSHLYFRHWSAYTQFKRSHLFVVPAQGGVALDLTPGDHDVPPFNLGGQDFYAVSPDGKELAYTSNIDEVEATSTNDDIFSVPITGGTPKKISTSPGADSTPLYSPDGRFLAWRTQARAGYESDCFRLLIYDRASGKQNIVTEAFDRWVGQIAWSANSKYVYLSAEDRGSSPIYRVAATGGAVEQIIAGHDDEQVLSPDGRSLVFTRMSVQRPSDVYVADLDGAGRAMGEARKLTNLNDGVLNRLDTAPLESFWFTGADRTKVEGFILKPPTFDPARKYPVKFLIHGGPQGNWGDEWSYRWNAELFAADGYVVMMINPRGSTGYGQKFIEQISGDWGGRPYVDLMKGLDYALGKYSFLDRNRVCALGASYGGYMVDWIIGNTARFQCAVSHDGMFNTESAYGTTEEIYFNEWEFRGTPWTNRALYRKWSPHLRAANIKTPTLVVHGQLDYRLDLSEGLQLFTTLQRLKVPSKMLYFPDEGHFVLKPQNSRLWYQTVNGWVDTYLKGAKTAH